MTRSRVTCRCVPMLGTHLVFPVEQGQLFHLKLNIIRVVSDVCVCVSMLQHKVVGLLESVQNNSAALSSLQTAWRQGNDVLAKNITDLSHEVCTLHITNHTFFV